MAEIEDEGSLGLDVLMKEEGPADGKLSEDILKMNGEKISCIQVGCPQLLRKVTVSEGYEKISNVVVDRFDPADE
ncbi:hypothetical protein KP79_PYT17579 [Mizuhopecten yessoensis]|uniref:Uncharacterized protein n=1 Tax=Mizuhopecten yessoensis TaxID=6573 RepID=A0A210QG70_MIZYE|nr:hypothetical protein KP79_PYT17579 [Mizuhopecten yessoensis]